MNIAINKDKILIGIANFILKNRLDEEKTMKKLKDIGWGFVAKEVCVFYASTSELNFLLTEDDRVTAYSRCPLKTLETSARLSLHSIYLSLNNNGDVVAARKHYADYVERKLFVLKIKAISGGSKDGYQTHVNDCLNRFDVSLLRDQVKSSELDGTKQPNINAL